MFYQTCSVIVIIFSWFLNTNLSYTIGLITKSRFDFRTLGAIFFTNNFWLKSFLLFEILKKHFTDFYWAFDRKILILLENENKLQNHLNVIHTKTLSIWFPSWPIYNREIHLNWIKYLKKKNLLIINNKYIVKNLLKTIRECHRKRWNFKFWIKYNVYIYI